MKRVRFIMVGGFLGAGKTTTLARLASEYQKRGQRVGVVTNDQAQDLVDTNALRSQGLAVEEVAGACFCCRFDDLVGKIGALQDSDRPDVILAEPVGSCTDLVATVVQPLKDLYGTRFSVAPYAVLFKPSHGMKILGGTESGFSPKAAYIFLKQLEEADAVVLNRIDELRPEEIDRLTALVASRSPDVPLLKVSARTGDGFAALMELLDREGDYGRRILAIDYDTYAEGEAELGWLNSSAAIESDTPFELDELLMEIIGKIGAAMARSGGEVAHLKAIGLADATYAVANLVSSGSRPELSLPSRANVTLADLIINARAAVDPDWLRGEVERVLDGAATSRGARLTLRAAQSLRPGRPTPTHRYERVVS